MRTTSNALVVTLVCLGMPAPANGVVELRRVPIEPSQDQGKKETADQTVTGSVADRDGKPIERAQVIFDGPKKATLLTDATGHFTFSGPPGDYTITVRAGNRSASFTRRVEGNQLKPTATLTIEPEAPPR
jgi:Carboxypeptidase regulatory-like domain